MFTPIIALSVYQTGNAETVQATQQKLKSLENVPMFVKMKKTVDELCKVIILKQSLNNKSLAN